MSHSRDMCHHGTLPVSPTLMRALAWGWVRFPVVSAAAALPFAEAGLTLASGLQVALGLRETLGRGAAG